LAILAIHSGVMTGRRWRTSTEVLLLLMRLLLGLLIVVSGMTVLVLVLLLLLLLLLLLMLLLLLLLFEMASRLGQQILTMVLMRRAMNVGACGLGGGTRDGLTLTLCIVEKVGGCFHVHGGIFFVYLGHDRTIIIFFKIFFFFVFLRRGREVDESVDESGQLYVVPRRTFWLRTCVTDGIIRLAL
jgi:hypothetical protein